MQQMQFNFVRRLCWGRFSYQSLLPANHLKTSANCICHSALLFISFRLEKKIPRFGACCSIFKFLRIFLVVFDWKLLTSLLKAVGTLSAPTFKPPHDAKNLLRFVRRWNFPQKPFDVILYWTFNWIFQNIKGGRSQKRKKKCSSLDAFVRLR